MFVCQHNLKDFSNAQHVPNAVARNDKKKVVILSLVNKNVGVGINDVNQFLVSQCPRQSQNTVGHAVDKEPTLFTDSVILARRC